MNAAGPGRDLGAILAEFAQAMVGERSIEATLTRLGIYCTELLPIHGVGVLLREPGGGLVVATANTEAGRIVEQLEADLGEGPCTDCIRLGEQVVVPDLAAAEPRYPRFAPRALGAGVHSVHGLPLVVRGEQMGSMDLISLEPLALDADQLATAQLLGDVAIAYLANSRAFDEVSTLAGQLQQALDSRVVIEQAKGKLAERHGTDVNQAFDRLRGHARKHGRKLRDVATEVLDGSLDP